VAPPTTKPRVLKKLRPDLFLFLQDPPRPAGHPAHIYLHGFSSPNSQRAMTRALERIAELISFPVNAVNWWGIPIGHHWSIREELATRYAPATANQSLSALRGVLAIALQRKLMSPALYEAAVAIPLVPSSARTAGRTPSKRQIERLIRTAQGSGDPKGARDAAILGVLTGAGLKRSEVAALRLADYEPRSGRLTLGSETILLGPRERALLRAWMSHRGRAHGALFLPMRKSGRIERRQMSGQAVAAIVAERAALSALGRLSPEDLRRAHLASPA